jgi:Na+/proline symporter
MLAARNEKEAMGATLWFNVAHYGLRPWPWILVALASLLVYPSLESIQVAFPHLDPSIIRNDLAYPAMLVFLPHGLLGLVVASLAAAYMSTISTHLNWGASYVVDDFYRRFINDTEEDRHYVTVGRITTVGLIVLAGIVALWLENALQAFQILLQIGAGTGLVFLLRWFWWRINAWSEVAAMVVSFLVAVYFLGGISLSLGGMEFALDWPVPDWSASAQLVAGVVITTAGWLTVTFLTRPASIDTLRSYYRAIRPFGATWRRIMDLEPEAPRPGMSPVAAGFLGWFLGLATIYGALFGVGYVLYGNAAVGTACLAVAAVAMLGIFRVLPKVGL